MPETSVFPADGAIAWSCGAGDVRPRRCCSNGAEPCHTPTADAGDRQLRTARLRCYRTRKPAMSDVSASQSPMLGPGPAKPAVPARSATRLQTLGARCLKAGLARRATRAQANDACPWCTPVANDGPRVFEPTMPGLSAAKPTVPNHGTFRLPMPELGPLRLHAFGWPHALRPAMPGLGAFRPSMPELCKFGPASPGLGTARPAVPKRGTFRLTMPGKSCPRPATSPMNQGLQGSVCRCRSSAL